MSTEAKLRTIRIDEDGKPGPTNYSGECPKCGGKIKGVLPASLPSKTIECPGCGGKLTVKHSM